MKTPQFSTPKLSASSEYALILGAGASAAVSLAAQQVAAASLPLTALVAIGLLNRRRLDQQLKDNEPANLLSKETSIRKLPDGTKQVTAKPTPESVSAQLCPSTHNISQSPPNNDNVNLSRPSASNVDSAFAARFSSRHKQFDGKPASSQEASLQKIGAHLRQVRQEKALSLRDIHEQTFIQVYVLIAIEGGNLRSLPEPFYVRAFIQKYASVLGLKGREIAAEFPVE